MKFSWRDFELDFGAKTQVMGILNVTPDSFSDGGVNFDSARAVDRAFQMASEGADIVDVGGQSTRPGSEPVGTQEESRRVVPVIEALVKAGLKVPVSVDTYDAEVARRALEAGAAMVNDISGLQFDAAMAGVVARAQVPVVLMHIKGTPRDMQRAPHYDALVPEVMDYLRGSIAIARDAGVRDIVIDPGIGFGKSFEDNLELIRQMGEFAKLGYPVLAGPSRKAFIGHYLGGLPVDERMEGTAAVVAACVLNGAHAVRVHDVKQMSRVVRMCDAIAGKR